MRYDYWPQRLNRYIVDQRDNKYQLGVHDCCIFTAGGVIAITNTYGDPMKEFRDMYHDKATLTAALKAIGAGSLFRTLVKKFGKSIPGHQACKGDVVFNEGACGIAIGVYGIFISGTGYGLVPISSVDRAFKVK